jgi:hypothetical protein
MIVETLIGFPLFSRMPKLTRKRGRPLSDQLMAAIQLRLPAELLARLDSVASDNFEPRAVTIRRYIVRGLKTEKKG